MGAPARLEQGTLVGGKLRVVRTLGVGGMGAVYEVQHEITRHHRALKLLHADVRDQHPDLVRRFLREASVAGTLGNPHIVETFDAGELESGEPFVLMELLSGESLADRLARGPLDVGQAVSVVRQMCDAMAAAHDKGIVHRDLKPDNTYLCAAGPGTPTGEAGAPFVKVLDFGISRFAEAEGGPSAHTSEGLVLGTPYYMPPEQARGVRDLDARADVYALGVILYEALAGRRPFEASSMAHLVVLIHEGNAPPLSSVRPGVPAGLADVVAKAMQADRDQRYPDARSLSAALAPYVHVHDAGLAETQLAPVPVPGTDRALASTTLEPRSSTLAEAKEPARPSRSVAWLAGALVVGLGLFFGVRASLAPSAASSASATAGPSAGPSAPSGSIASVIATASIAAASASAPVASASAPIASAPVAVASAPVAVASAPVGPASGPAPTVPGSAAASKPAPKPSGSSKSQQAGLTPDL